MAEKSGDDDSSSSSDSDTSDSSRSSFGCQAEDESPKKKGRGAPKAVAKAKRKSTSSAVTKSDAPTNRLRKKTPQKASQDAEKKLRQNLETAGKFLASLQELKCDTLWRSCVRAGEVDRRLGREAAVVNSIDSLPCSEEMPEEASSKS